MNFRSGLAGLLMLPIVATSNAATPYDTTVNLKVRSGQFDGVVEQEKAPRVLKRVPFVNDLLTARGTIRGNYHGDTINIKLNGGILVFKDNYQIQFVSRNTVDQVPYLEHKRITAQLVYTKHSDKHPERDSTVTGVFSDSAKTINAKFYARHWPNETFTGYILYMGPARNDSVPVFGTFVPDSAYKTYSLYGK